SRPDRNRKSARARAVQHRGESVSRSVTHEDVAQVWLADHNNMVEAFPADRADQALRLPVLPRRAWRPSRQFRRFPRLIKAQKVLGTKGSPFRSRDDR